MISVWAFWLAVAAIFVIAEVLTQSLWMLCIALGCAAAILPWYFGLGTAAQLFVVAAVAVLSYLLFAKPLKRRLHERAAAIPDSATGMDALVGQTATVLQAIEPGRMGRVRAYGDNWQAVAEQADASIPAGSRVRILSYDSIILTVTQIPN